MTDKDPSEWAKRALQVLAVPGEIIVAAHGYPGFIATGAILLESVIPDRKRDGEEFVGVVGVAVGQERLENIIKSDDERREMLWTGTQAAMATGLEGKRIVMARVVANAMTSDEPIDEAQLMLWALAELDAPHFRSLKRIQETQDANQGNKSLDDILYALLTTLPYPVMAALARTGVVRQGSERRGEDGRMFSVTYADTLSISGISDFGRRMLANLESVDTEF